MEDVPEELQLFPAALDYRAETVPNETYAFLPKGNSLEDGFSPLTWRALANAVNEMSWWLDEVLGGKVTGLDFPALPYVGADDLRYVLLTYAAAKTKRKELVPLATNTPEATLNLLKISEATVVFASKGYEHFFDLPMAEMENLKLITMPEITHFVHDRPVEHYPYTRKFNEGLDDPFFVISTSGTTGNAKPLEFTFRSGLFYVEDARASRPEALLAIPELLKNAHCPIVFPLSWGAGLSWCSNFVFAYGIVPIMPPPSAPQPMTPEYLNEFTKVSPKGDKNALTSVPEVLRRLVRVPEYLDNLKHYDWIGYAGAPLDHSTGDLISQYSRVQSFMGSGESGAYPLLLNDPKDWKIHRFHPTYAGFFLEHFTEDLYELCIRKEPRDGRVCFLMDPSIDVYHTKDLWRPVPGREGYWSSAGRVDDFVKLSSLTKFNAVQLEHILSRNPGIEAVIVAGDARKHPFALVQLAGVSQGSRDDDLDRIWPAFEEMNKHVSGEAQVTRDLVLLTDPNNPIKRTAKGTVDRRNTLKMYGEQIDALYENVGYERLPNGATGEAK